MDVVKMESLLRVLAILVLVLTASLVRFDTQTKVIVYTIVRKATFRDMDALHTLVYIAYAAAGYNVLQLARCFVSSRFKSNPTLVTYRTLAWACFLLDQAAVYLVFGGNSAALEASVLAVTGANSFEWEKVCNKYTRFCFQIGGALSCGFVASLLLAAVSSVSAFNLFRLYSPNHFLLVKSTTT